eukprot:TRINITY_DN7851_c0_g1_i3.p2 TRINITY_DN7851_c0_g1~~TRINITY_DN7851_c0_g1_i3.p2  ORF type:complete len:117 (-),score=18.35 TRINITY_DN7851_c0_g1_i3:896-1246(-)
MLCLDSTSLSARPPEDPCDGALERIDWDVGRKRGCQRNHGERKIEKITDKLKNRLEGFMNLKSLIIINSDLKSTENLPTNQSLCHLHLECGTLAFKKKKSGTNIPTFLSLNDREIG